MNPAHSGVDGARSAEDQRIDVGMEAVRANAQAKAQAELDARSTAPDIFAGPPILFDEYDAPEIPASLLPGTLGRFASALATGTETPEAMAVMACLGAVATAVSKKFVISPIDTWAEKINIYTLVALPPGSNKSFVLNACTAPLKEWEQAQAAVVGPEIQRAVSERKTMERQIDSLRAQAGKAVKNDADPDTQRALVRRISEMEADLRDPPAMPTLYANDATPESLAQCVYEQGGRFAIFSDEGGIIETLSGLYTSGAANIDILLKGIDGGDVRVRRRNSAHNYDMNPFLTLVLTVQPAVLTNMSEKKVFSGVGLLERFLYALPKSRLGFRTHDKPPVPAQLQAEYGRLIRGLLDIPMPKPDAVPRLSLADAARDDWRLFQRAIEVQLRPGERLSRCAGWGSKISGFALRLAGLLHLAEHGGGQFHVISDDTMSNALKLATLLTEHALAAFGLMSADEASADAKDVADWITKHGQPSFKKADVTTAMRHRKCGRAKRLDAALEVLAHRNFVLPLPKAQGSKTVVYLTNPALLERSIH